MSIRSGSLPLFQGVVRQTASMRTRDGVRLDADVYRPAGDGPWPVLLMRQPYGRAIASTIVYAHPSWYARAGYLVVIQDVRGRGTSEGEFRLMEAEREDGADSVAWAAGLPGSSGAVGMYGFSYQGMTQFMAAADRPPALKCLAPAMAAWDVHAHFATEGDAFRLQAGLGWGCQLALETVRRAGDPAAHQAILAAARALPLGSEVPARPPVAALLGRHGHYLDWLTEPAGSDYWRRVSPAHAGAIDLPALHVGGWYDPLLAGTLAGYHAMAGRAPQMLVVGPWVHIPWAREVGARDFGPEASSRIDQVQLRWFDHWLKGRDTGLLAESPVRLFELGGGWREFAAFPAPAPQAWRIASGGRAGMDPADGTLAPDAAGDGEDVIVFDPWRPTPSVGGHAGHPAGPLDRAAADARSDVLTYTTPPRATALHLAGDVAVEAAVACDQPSFDLSCVLSEVLPNGQVFELASGHRRIEDAAPVARVSLRAICARIPVGSRLRLSIAAGSFPFFPVNSGTGLPPAEERLIDQRITTVVLAHRGTVLHLGIGSDPGGSRPRI